MGKKAKKKTGKEHFEELKRLAETRPVELLGEPVRSEALAFLATGNPNQTPAGVPAPKNAAMAGTTLGWLQNNWVIQVVGGVIAAVISGLIIQRWITPAPTKAPPAAPVTVVRPKLAVVNRGQIGNQTNIGQIVLKPIVQTAPQQAPSNGVSLQKTIVTIDRAIEDGNNALPGAQKIFQDTFNTRNHDLMERNMLASGSAASEMREATTAGAQAVDSAALAAKRKIEDALLEQGLTMADLPRTAWLEKESKEYSSFVASCENTKKGMKGSVEDFVKHLDPRLR